MIESSPAQSSDDSRFLSSVQRSFTVLELVAANPPGLSLTEAATLSNFPLPTVQRMLNGLVSLGYLEKDRSKRFHVSACAIELMAGYLARNRLAKASWPHLVKLREELGTDVSLSIPLGLNMIYVHRLPAHRGAFENTLPGKKRAMPFSASGRCVMAAWNDDLIAATFSDRLPSDTPYSVTTVDELLLEIEKVRKSGFCLVEQEAEIGTSSVAIPIRKGDKVVAGVTAHFDYEKYQSPGLRTDSVQKLRSAARSMVSG